MSVRLFVLCLAIICPPSSSHKGQGVSPILVEARGQMRSWVNNTFKKCPGSQRRTDERYTLLNGRLINFSDLVFSFDSTPLSRLEEKDGLEFKGSIRLIKADYREYDVKATRWGRFSDNAFISKGGALPDLIRVEKKRGSDWRTSFDSPYKSISASCENLNDESVLASLFRDVEREAGGEVVDTDSIYLKEAQTHAKKIIDVYFNKCGDKWYTYERMEFTSAPDKLVETTNLTWQVDRDILTLTPAERADGIEWKGVVKISALYYRYYNYRNWTSGVDLPIGWTRHNDGAPIGAFFIEKQNGKWFVVNYTSGVFFSGFSCAIDCSFAQRPQQIEDHTSFYCSEKKERWEIR